MLTKNGGYEMCVRLVIHCYIFSLLAFTYLRKNQLLNWTPTDQRTSQILLASFQKITQVTNNKLRSDRKKLRSGEKKLRVKIEKLRFPRFQNFLAFEKVGKKKA